MKVGFITTIDTNIGDDFIRTGIQNILQKAFPGQSMEYVLVNKHKPYTAYASYHPLSYVPAIRRIRGGGRASEILIRLLSPLGGSKLDNCDVIIQSGAPVLWPDCQQCEWNEPIWQQIVGRLCKEIPVLNIAAGSCYPWETQPPGRFSNPQERTFAEQIGGYCRLTTTRDELAHSLFNSTGVVNVLKPCTALFVDPTFENTSNGDYILVNYMRGGGHFSWNQEVNDSAWETTMREVINDLKRKIEVRFICHNQKEVNEAKALDPTLQVIYPKTVSEYLQIVTRARAGINNRMHASVAMASVGVPAISICTDTRLLMLKNIGLPFFYVKNANAPTLMAKMNDILSNVTAERERLFELKKRAFDEYESLFRDTLAKN